MQGKMQGVTLFADWEPRPGFKLGTKDIEGRQTYLGSRVWRNPRVEIANYDIPKPGPRDVLLQVKACGICGSDVHIAQADDDGYTFYPGLTGFPCILGHEISGIVVEAGREAYDKETNKPFKGGERVCTEEMVWCGECKPCADGYPNHCERLDEVGININGGFAQYLAVPARLLWSLNPLEGLYRGDNIFLAGSLVEPTSVAYNAVIERGGGIKPGDRAVVCGGGPVGMAACTILKREGASVVILSEPQEERAALGLAMGADYIVNPLTENFTEKVLDLTRGMGADLYLEATGLPTVVYPQIEQTIWEGRSLNVRVVVLARADAKMPVTGEVLQVRRASIIGTQGHSGHGIFARVIESMADGMDMTRIITKKISLEQVPENIVMLRTDRKECKVTCLS
jgi:threonine dehydrogenase-like Zn-dependent dehydrogenase